MSAAARDSPGCCCGFCRCPCRCCALALPAWPWWGSDVVVSAVLGLLSASDSQAACAAICCLPMSLDDAAKNNCLKQRGQPSGKCLISYLTAEAAQAMEWFCVPQICSGQVPAEQLTMPWHPQAYWHCHHSRGLQHPCDDPIYLLNYSMQNQKGVQHMLRTKAGQGRTKQLSN